MLDDTAEVPRELRPTRFGTLETTSLPSVVARGTVQIDVPIVAVIRGSLREAAQRRRFGADPIAPRRANRRRSAAATRSPRRDDPVAVAVATVRMVEMPLHQVVDMVAVRDGFVTAAGTMQVPCVVTTARVRGRTVRGIRTTHRERVLVHVPVVRVVEMTVVEVVDVAVVLDGGVSARRAVDVIVLRVNLVAHGLSPGVAVDETRASLA